MHFNVGWKEGVQVMGPAFLVSVRPAPVNARAQILQILMVEVQPSPISCLHCHSTHSLNHTVGLFIGGIP